MPGGRNQNACAAIMNWLRQDAPQDQEFTSSDLYKMVSASGLVVGYSTLLHCLQECVADGTVSKPDRGVYAIHLKQGQRALLSMPAVHGGDITLHDIHKQLVIMTAAINDLASKLKGV